MKTEVNNVSTTIVVLIALIFLIAGTAQTVSLKWADKLSASDRFYGMGYSNNYTNNNKNDLWLRENKHTMPESNAFYHVEGKNLHALHSEKYNNSTYSGKNDKMQKILTSRVDILYNFAHPFTQAFFMFSGEAFCLVVFTAIIIYRRYLARYLHHQRAIRAKLTAGVDVALPCNVCVWILTAGSDFIASIIQNVGLILTDASLFQMLRGAAIVWVGVISYFWLHRRFIKVEYWGMMFVVVGLTLVGLSTITTFDHGTSTTETRMEGNQRQSKQSLQTLGNLLVISAQILHAYQGVCQERIVRLYQVPPLQMIGIEGVYGITLTISLLAFLQLVPMTWRGHNFEGLVESYTFVNAMALPSPLSSQTESLITKEVSLHSMSALSIVTKYNKMQDYYSYTSSWIDRTGFTWLYAWESMQEKVPYDDIILAFDQMHQSSQCRNIVIIYIVSGFVYNASQMFIIKYLSAAALVMIGSLRNISVWAFCLCLPSVFGERFRMLQFIGFIFLMLGNVLFQRVWITRFDDILPQRVISALPLLFQDTPSPVTELELVTSSPSVCASKNVEADLDLTEMSTTPNQVSNIACREASDILVTQEPRIWNQNFSKNHTQ